MKEIRGLAWVVLKWALHAPPNIFFLAVEIKKGVNEMNKNTISNASYKTCYQKFWFDITLKFLPCSLIVILVGYRLTSVPPVLNFYLILHLFLLGIIVFTYTWLSMELIFTWIDIRKKCKGRRYEDEV
ncbi:hypothetical protein QJV45_18215 [Listeria booriae]|uniref:hypothetical protein n=1 Tax=Listeria booriae TaxID=1552123 RepID=UPI002880B595|nr:hypothetical protein [Listeria booriae]MDT0112405.1 hypothetical protein [Listeria booriae]